MIKPIWKKITLYNIYSQFNKFQRVSENKKNKTPILLRSLKKDNKIVMEQTININIIIMGFYL